MSSMVVYFTDEEDRKLSLLIQKWGIPKYKVVKKIINDFKEQEVTK